MSVTRKFFSYGPVDKDIHYYAERSELFSKAVHQLMGENPEKGGHYITVWAPRQCGKTWLMNNVLWQLSENEKFHVLKLELEYLKQEEDTDGIVSSVGQDIIRSLNLKNVQVRNIKEFRNLFHKDVLDKPLILIMDEFDALNEKTINSIVSSFRYIYNARQKDPNPSDKKEYLLHSLALIGVRSVLGIENVKGSPFNVQRSLHIPNLTFAECEGMFRWYERESGQKVEQPVIERVFYETQGQPGLIGWFGELLTETYNKEPENPITLQNFEYAFKMAVQVLPNNNILNIISKARQEPYADTVLDLFKPGQKMLFRFDRPDLNYLYMNGVIGIEETGTDIFVKFASPFVQKRLFNYFSDDIFRYTGQLHEPFADLSDVFPQDRMNMKNLMRTYENYLKCNREWLFGDAPRRKDLRIFEAVFHFNLYRFLCDFLGTREGKVWPEFPTGNGKIDLMIVYNEHKYALEIKSWADEIAYEKALTQAARYGLQLGLPEITLVFFVENIDSKSREKYEKEITDEKSGVKVETVFVETGK
ncbi:MAG: AAA-like domain-containing protein [Desulfobacterales bacterium]